MSGPMMKRSLDQNDFFSLSLLFKGRGTLVENVKKVYLKKINPPYYTVNWKKEPLIIGPGNHCTVVYQITARNALT
jgi:hypothetical protein